MWARVVEVMLGCWLIISPFIFRLPSDATFLWVTDFVCGTLIIVIALTAIRPKIEKVHFLNLLVAAYLIIISYASGETPPSAPYQNYMTVALLLVILAVIPTRGILPPRTWQAFYEKEAEKDT